MAYNLLNQAGVETLWATAKNKFVSKEAGKGLSSNDLTNTLLAKLNATASTTYVDTAVDGMATETYVSNTIADAIADKASTTYVDNKVSDKVTTTALNTAISTAVTPLAPKTYVDDAVSNKATTTAVNDAITSAITPLAAKTYVDSSISSVRTDLLNSISLSTEKKMVSSLPASPDAGDTNKIFLVSKVGTTDNIYNEYIFIDEKWELIGDTGVTLDGYLQEIDLHFLTTAELNDILI